METTTQRFPALAEIADREQRRNQVRAKARTTGRPTLTAETATKFLDWITEQLMSGGIDQGEATLLMRAAELAISTRHADAQGKATQHTLVEDGTISPPPGAAA